MNLISLRTKVLVYISFFSKNYLPDAPKVIFEVASLTIIFVEGKG
jgi:hypothetical protein